ncbi:MAG: hypothetical protein L0226_04085 [Acidobacteria bacterium]|nr:hypothetical protein [Acidobacteriota bacterium]
MLRNIPDGIVCYIDTTIFYYHLVSVPPLSDDCSDFLSVLSWANCWSTSPTLTI